MILKLVDNQQAQTMPFVAGVILLIVAVLMVSLSISSISVERTDQQAAADSAALAGANVLAKSKQTIEIINFIMWLRNIMIDLLYSAVTIVNVATLGSLTGLYEIPFNFETATRPAMDALDRAKEAIKEIAPIYAVGSSVAYVQANNKNGYFGIAVPFPIELKMPPPTAAEKQLKEKINIKNQEILAARQIMDKAWIDYYKRKNELVKQGKSEDQIQNDPVFKALKLKAQQKSGSVGRKTADRNIMARALADLEAKRGKYFKAGEDGLVAMVVHENTEVPYASFVGGAETGFNIAVSAAKATSGKKDIVVGQQAIKNLFSGVPLLNKTGEALNWLLSALNVYGRNAGNLGDKYGPIGGVLTQLLNKMNLIPPEITEIRPTLTSTKDATNNTFDSRLGGLVGDIKDMVKTIHEIEKKFGRKVLPDSFEI